MESKIKAKISPFGKSQTPEFRGLRQPAIPLLTHNRKHFEGIPGLALISESPATSGCVPHTPPLFEPPTS